MTELQRKIQDIFGSDALDWWDVGYVGDWLSVALFWILSQLAAHAPIFERDIPLDDSSIGRPHMHQQVSGRLNTVVAVYIPLAMVATVGAYRGSVMEMHHGALALLASRGLTRLITEFLKNRVGRLRPDFLASCQWNALSNACNGDAIAVYDGRKSFPSGHSSGAFAGMMFMTLWIGGKSAALCFGMTSPRSRPLSSRLPKFTLTITPLFWAMFVAITRVEDNRHHVEDVVAGSFVGIVCSAISYLTFWPSPFTIASFTSGNTGCAKLVYKNETNGRSRNIDFELEGLEQEIDNV